jgi:UDP-N-acetylmuramate dehydrogenase
MNKVEHKISLQPFNTFGVSVLADQLLRITSVLQLQRVLRENKPPVLILGGGSNILFTDDVEGLILKNEIRGKQVVEESGQSVLVEVGSGENWHKFVQWCLEQDFGGVENLSLIPGTVGAAPIQNIGAYDVELCEVFEKLEAVELQSGSRRTFYRNDCHFEYRDSIFKRTLKEKYFITRVFLRLTKTPHHRIDISYGALRGIIREMGIDQPTIQQVSRAVIQIRDSKLPNPEQLGNAGSFFKNPVIREEQLADLKGQFPEIVCYPAGEGMVKVPAGWLIEQCGWKGRRFGSAGCYEKQALVLVNYGGATGGEICELARRIARSVEEKFGIELEREVNVFP